MHHKSRGMTGVAGLALALTLLFTPLTGQALGLGKLKVHSALNAPLNAEIEITSVGEKELRGLNVGLASRRDFEDAAVARLPFLSEIKFTVVKRADGGYVLQLRTEQQIEEPFLHLLLQLDWPGGRLVREYTALIDPPSYLTGKPAGIEPPRVAPAPKPEPVPVPLPVPTAQIEPQALPAEETRVAEVPTAPADDRLFGPENMQPSSVVISDATGWPVEAEERKAVEPSVTAAPRPAVVPAWAGASEYRVKQGDTLWEIAEKLRADKRLGMEQAVIALYNANRHAFFGNNVNNLHAGKILKVPEREEVEAISQSLARKEFRAQYDVWQEYKLKLAGAGRGIKVAGAETETAQAPAKPEQAAKAPAAEGVRKPEPEPAEKGRPGELLKIVRANLHAEKGAAAAKVAETESRKGAAGEHRALAEKVATLEESLESRRLQTQELANKVGQVRAQLKNEARLIELENKEFAAAQARAKPQDIKPVEPAPKPEAAKPPEKPVPKATAPEKPAAPPVPVVAAAKPEIKKPVAPPSPPEGKGWLDELAGIFGGEFVLPALIGVVVFASGAIALVYFRRRRKSLAEFEESILSSEPVTGEGASSATTGPAITAGDTSFLSDFSQGAAGPAHTDEVDPIAEAEVYLAYGRDETAEEILKDAVVKNPGRPELKVKLLEIYHQRKDLKAFETLAEELYAAFGGRGGKPWEKVEEMGRKLNPENPMFRGGAPAKPAAVPKPKPAAAPDFGATVKMSAEELAMALTPAPAAGAPAQASASPAGDFDFDLGAPAPAASGGGIDFDLDFATAKPAAAPAVDFGATMKLSAAELGTAPTADTGLESLDFGQPLDNLIDFDVGAGAPAAAGAPSAEEAAAPAGAEAGGIEWEMSAPAGAESAPAEETQSTAQWDETATKLDLAKAYIDMGDAEGARSILEEVMAEGNDQQKTQAKELAAQLA